MAVGIILEWDGFDTSDYDGVCERIGFPANWPEALISHAAGQSEEGLRLTEIWESREDFDRWIENVIQPAVGEIAGDRVQDSPPNFVEFSLHRYETRE
jgi:hypothetical protein